MNKIKFIMAIMLVCIAAQVRAQYAEVTYEHEEGIMNQFTVMETGANSLTPSWY